MLFSRKQRGFQCCQTFCALNMLKHNKNKCFVPIFIVCALQMLIVMGSCFEVIKMSRISPVQIRSTANVAMPIDEIANDIDARGARDRIIHDLNCLSFMPCFSRRQTGEATRFLHQIATLMLGDALILPFFLIFVNTAIFNERSVKNA